MNKETIEWIMAYTVVIGFFAIIFIGLTGFQLSDNFQCELFIDQEDYRYEDICYSNNNEKYICHPVNYTAIEIHCEEVAPDKWLYW